MAREASVEVHVSGFRWFREILVRGGDLIEALASEDLSPEAARRLRSFAAVYHDPNADSDDCPP
jgi:hypothetical protein